jgi:IS605 OrfB family transposase
MTYKFKLANYYHNLKSWTVQNAQLIVSDNCCYLNVQVKCDEPEQMEGDRRLGIDRGIINIAVCSDNTFYNSKHLKNVKGRYQHLKMELQRKGTQSANRHLRKLAGGERRFVRDTNHCISKDIAKKDFDIFCIEDLTNIRSVSKGRRFNEMLGNWSFSQLELFLTYKLESIGKRIMKVNPRYTSQTCSHCGHREKSNRKGTNFKCKVCGYSTNADLNASRNIATFSRAVCGRVQSTTQSSASRYGKPTNSLVGS